MNHYLVMALSMILSGFLSTMNVWANSWSDVRISLNDVYMVTLMTGWMFFFMGIFTKNLKETLIGFSIVLPSLVCIRFQLFINQTQYLLGMIPHHSMAILMSSRLQEKTNDIPEYLESIIIQQGQEIQYMKSILNSNI